MAAGAPAGLASRPRGLLASASHSGRGLVPPRAPGRGQLSPPFSPPPRRRPLPPDRALNHPSPLPQKPPHAAGPRRARPRGCEPPAPPRVCVVSAASRPQAAQAPELRRGDPARLRRDARPSPRRGGQRGRRRERSSTARLPELLSSAPPTAAEETAAQETGGGVGDGSAEAALIAFIRRCLPSRRRRGMWTPLIGRESPARRGRRGPAPSPGALPRARCAPTPPAGPASSRAPPPVTRIEAARVCARRPPPRPRCARCGARTGGGRARLSAATTFPFRPRARIERGVHGWALCAGCPAAEGELPGTPGWQGGAGTPGVGVGGPRRARTGVLGSSPCPGQREPCSAS